MLIYVLVALILNTAKSSMTATVLWTSLYLHEKKKLFERQNDFQPEPVLPTPPLSSPIEVGLKP